MTNEDHRSAYLSALDSAREELVQIVEQYNWMLRRQESLKLATETLEAFLATDCFPQTENMQERAIPAVRATAVVPPIATPAPVVPPIEQLVESAVRPQVAVQELPSDPILRRIHGALDLVSVG